MAPRATEKTQGPTDEGHVIHQATRQKKGQEELQTPEEELKKGTRQRKARKKGKMHAH